MSPAATVQPETPVWALVLAAFAAGDLVIHPPEFAARNRLDKAPVYRVCAEMEAAGFLERAATTQAKAYRAGPAVARLAAGYLQSNAYEAQRVAAEIVRHARFLEEVGAQCATLFGAATAPRTLHNAQPQEQSA